NPLNPPTISYYIPADCFVKPSRSKFSEEGSRSDATLSPPGPATTKRHPFPDAEPRSARGRCGYHRRPVPHQGGPSARSDRPEGSSLPGRRSRTYPLQPFRWVGIRRHPPVAAGGEADRADFRTVRDARPLELVLEEPGVERPHRPLDQLARVFAGE